MADAAQPILEARDVIKYFGAVKALCGVSFDLRPGEIHALCGENGAGKSTLIKTLSGIHPYGSYEGQLLVDGREVRFSKIADAGREGIAVIYQELALIDDMTVAENIFLGQEPTRHGRIDWLSVYRQSRELLDRFGIVLDPATPVLNLGVGQKQLVEIVKALSKNSRILILDEPTAALSEAEVGVLLNILRDLRTRGIACVYISHKLDEVFAIADRITVLRDGKSIVTLPTRETNASQLIRHMVGREITALFPRRAPAATGPAMFSVQNLSVLDPVTRKPRLQDISLEVHAGEVLGLGGLMGAGRTELLMHLFGIWGRRLSGIVRLAGNLFTARTPDRAIASGLVLVSEDRKRYGLILEQTTGFNLSLSSLDRLSRLGLLDNAAEVRRNQDMFARLRVKASGLEAVTGRLSGGNQQKVVLGKALLTTPKVIFLDEPTRGIDVGAKLEVYELINQLTDAGQAVVLVSSELPELMGMSDRIVMLSEGRIGGVFSRAEATQEKLLAAAIATHASAVKEAAR
ncbi:MAG: ATP-binding cassette domain-containing protein [Phycisphaerae bacterium]